LIIDFSGLKQIEGVAATGINPTRRIGGQRHGFAPDVHGGLRHIIEAASNRLSGEWTIFLKTWTF
jgi:hypothetical protein